MSLSIEPKKGIRLKLSNYSVIKTWQGGGKFWEHDFQLTIRQGTLQEFLPRATEQGDSVFYEHFVENVEGASASTQVSSLDQVPGAQIERLRGALAELKAKAEDPHCDTNKKRMIEAFRLPDPQKDAELYRLYGSGSNRKLIVLWGVEKEIGSALTPLKALERVPQKTGGGSKNWLWVLLIILLLIGAWFLFRKPAREESVAGKSETDTVISDQPLDPKDLAASTKPPADPTAPAKPPTDPTAPTKPPSDPAAPTKQPTEPTAPAKPPTDPTAPTKPPTDPTAPAKPPTDPTAPTKPPTDPTAPAKPPTDPTAPTKPPTDPTAPAKPPTDPTAPTKPPTDPTAPTKPPTDSTTQTKPDARVKVSTLEIISTRSSSIPKDGRVEVLLNVLVRDESGALGEAPQITEWSVDGKLQRGKDGKPLTGASLPTQLTKGTHRVSVVGVGQNERPIRSEAEIIIDIKTTEASSVKVRPIGR